MKTQLFLSGNADHPRLIQGGPSDLALKIQAVIPGFTQLPVSVIDEDILLIQDKFPLNPTQRLVVLVPPGEIDEISLARRIWQLAASSCFNVLYVALSSDVTQTAYQRRLNGLVSLTSGPNVRVRAHVSAEKNWRQALEQILHPGDLLVCLASHQVSKQLFRRRKLGEQLAETVGVPVYLVSGFKIGLTSREWKAIKGGLAWVASLSLIAAFFGVQVSIDRSTSGPLSTIMVILSLVMEIYLLSRINELI